MADVFISYSRVDLAVAKTLAGYLNQQGVETWWDTQLAAGDIFSNKIRSEIACAKAVIVIWSESSANSLWVRSEAQEAYDTGKLVTVHVPGFDLRKIPLPFTSIHTESIDNSASIVSDLKRKISDKAITDVDAGNDSITRDVWLPPSDVVVYSFIQSIPGIVSEAYELAAPDWKTEAGNLVRQATYTVINAVERIWCSVADFYPPNHFGKPNKQYFSEFVAYRFHFRYALIEPNGYRTAGRMIHPMVASGVLRDVQEALVLSVRLLLLFRKPPSSFQIEDWERRFSTAVSNRRD